MMRTSIDHLPPSVQDELYHATHILLAEFEEVMRGKQAPHRKAGRILKLILFGAFSRSDWRERDDGADITAFDILVIVNHDELAEVRRYWRFAIDRLGRAWMAGQLRRPVRLTVQSLAMVNRALGEGLPFFVEIARDGIALYQMSGRPLATPHHLSAEERRDRAAHAYRTWFPKAGDFLAGALFFRDRSNAGMAALLLHQACEQLYRCILWTFTLHDRRTHALHDLRDLAEQQDSRLRDAWPRATRFERRAFSRIRRAYVEARYSDLYRIGDDELAWAAERTKRLHLLVDRACRDHLNTVRRSAQALVPHGTAAHGEIAGVSGRPLRFAPSPQTASHGTARINRLIREGTIQKHLPAVVPTILALLIGALLALLATGPVARAGTGVNETMPITIEVESPAVDDDWPDRPADASKPITPPAVLDFDVATGPLAEAVAAAARQAGYGIMSDATIWGDRQASALHVHGTITEALADLLHGSGLCASIMEDTVIVRRCASGQTTARPSAMS